MTDYQTIEHRGCRLAYRVQGAGEPVVLIQGSGVHGDGWTPQVRQLKQRYRCLTFDNRGMGRSQPLTPPITVEQMAEDTRAVMDAAGIESAHLISHSLGGLIALHVALSARQRVRSLTLLCTFAWGGESSRLTPWLLWTGTRTVIGTRPMRRRAFLEMVLPPGRRSTAELDALAAELEPIFGHDLGDMPSVARHQVSAMRAYDATPRLGELADIPTLVVSAEHDKMARPVAGLALALGIPGSRYVEIPGAAHGVPIERPDVINDLLIEHIEHVRRTPKPSQGVLV